MNALELSAFRQSSKIPRSPVRNREIGLFGQSMRTPRTPVNGRDSKLVVQGSVSLRGDMISAASGVFGQLGDQIRSLIEMLEDGKRRSIN